MARGSKYEKRWIVEGYEGGVGKDGSRKQRELGEVCEEATQTDYCFRGQGKRAIEADLFTALAL